MLTIVSIVPTTLMIVLFNQQLSDRVDSLTAFVALFTIVASHFLEGARWLDPVGGLIISGMIVQAGWVNTKSALLELADATMDEEVRASAQKAATDALSHGGAEIRGVQGIKSGQNLMFEIEVGVPADWTVSQSNEVETDIRATVAEKVRGTKRVNVRFTTSEKHEAAFLDEFVAEKGEEHVEENGDEHDHDHDHDHSHSHSDQPARKRK